MRVKPILNYITSSALLLNSWLISPCFAINNNLFIDNLSLYNSASDSKIRDITQNEIIDLAIDGSQLTITANPNLAAQKVSFTLTGAKNSNRTEKVAPYALAGDKSSDFSNANLLVGSYNLKITPYDTSGQAGLTYEYKFSVIDSSDNDSLSNPPAPPPPEDPISDPITESFGAFDKTKDLLSLHYDHAPDKDDGHATVAGKVLIDYYQIPNYLVVGGAYGKNASKYNQNSEDVMDATWGAAWFNAHENPLTGSELDGQGIGLPWLLHMLYYNDGNIYVAEGGQADRTLAAAKYVKNQGGDPSRITVIQHSNWNINNYGDGVLEELLALGVKHIKIEDGNSNNKTADLNTSNKENSSVVNDFVQKALASDWSQAWAAAFDYYSPNHRVDFSDTVEALHILGVAKSEVANITDFADKYFDVDISNPPPNNDNDDPDSDSEPPSDTNELNITLTLIDSETDSEIKLINEGDTISLSEGSGALSIRANASQNLSRLMFILNGPKSFTQTERVKPYALAGDKSGDYKDAKLIPGNYSLEIIPYNNGQALNSKLIPFSISL
ncbi:MAG: hypothetical protein HRT47_10930 [Candidatus Caenarcaniphilales bacterium]|nr:hypothetical protein [Candidatus Caenarcaniphilales bacterium]